MSKVGKLIREAKDLILVPEVYDCTSAKAAEINGFDAIMISSSDFACSLTGIPDLGLLSIDEYVMMTERICNMTDMPLILDADDGFGRPLSCYYACKRMARVGAAGVLITDDNENCREGIAPLELVKTRLKAARDGFAEIGDDALIIARCDLDPINEYQKFVDTCNIYLESGANMICPSPRGIHTYKGDKNEFAKRMGRDIKGWLWWPDLTADENGNPEIDTKDLFDWGWKMTGIHFSLHAAMLAMLDTGRHVFKDRDNVYVTKAYDWTGYKMFSSMALFMNDNYWVNKELKYVPDPKEANSPLAKAYFCRPDDCYDPDGKK